MHFVKRVQMRGALFASIMAVLVLMGGLFAPFGAGVAQAQGTLPFSENFSTFTGAGFNNPPVAGQLDSRIWRITGWSDGNTTFGGTHTTGDFARGTSAGGVTTGGTYAFNVGGGTRIFGVQPTGTEFNPGTITLRIQNTTGSTINSIDVAYTIYYYNDQPRSNYLDFFYSTNDSTYNAVASLNFVTPGAADATPTWQSVARSTTITGLNVADTEFIYLQWRGADVSGTGNRDEYGITDVTVGVSGAPDVAPSVTSTTPANGATGVAINSNLTVTFSEPVNVAGNWFEIDCASSGIRNVADTVVTGGPTIFTINPDVNFDNSEVCSVTVFASQVTDVDTDDPPDNMLADYSFSFTTADPPIVTRIHTIQGTGPVSPLVGNPVTVDAIVIGSYQTPNATNYLRGFFLQEADANVDADPNTSEGIFVFCSACPVTVNVGDRVRVTGNVSEFFDMTQISATTIASIEIVSNGNPLPTPATITLPVVGDVDEFYERYEGMLVTFTNTLTVSEYFQLERYGQIILYEGGRPFQFTHTNTPSAAGFLAHQDTLARRRVILDDTNNVQNEPISATGNERVYHPYPNGFSIGTQGVNYFRGGDIVSNLTGILHWSFAGLGGTDAWRIRPVEPQFPITFTPVNTRPSAPAIAGDIKVASYNVLNYFATIDTTASNTVGNCGPSPLGTMDCRGADSIAELVRQTDKLVTALLGLDADIFGLIEIENSTTIPHPALSNLVNALNAVAGAGTYAYIETGAIGTDAITNTFIYKPAVVQPVLISGNPFVIDTDSVHNRPPVAALFEVIDPLNPSFGERFSVVVNHFKSKSPSGASGADLDQLDGQSAFNNTRVAQANRLATWINSTLVPLDPDVLIIGDLNSYKREDPIMVLLGNGYTDLVEAFGGANAYSYVFDGQLGYLDHALANASLLPAIVAVSEWHINADESALFDYNDTVQDAGEAAFERKPNANPLYEVNPFRTSDHDPVIIGISFPQQPPATEEPPVEQPPTDGGGAPNIGVFDPAISKIGVLLPGQVGLTGEKLEWITNVSNTGTVAGTNVVVTDTLIDALQIDNVEAPNGTVSINGQTVTVTYASIAPGQTFTFSIFTTVINSNVTINNTACLNADGVAQRCATAPNIIRGLPATGESPMWRDIALIIVIMGGVVILIGGAWWQLRRAE